MEIAEFFVKLGIKGADKASNSLETIDDKIQNMKSSSLAAKAAILGAVYAVYRFTSGVAKTGTTLKQFETLTGISAKTLQQYQYAANQVGTTNEGVQSSFMGIQKAMTDMITKGQAPSGMFDLANTVGFDYNRAQDMIYVIQKLQEYAQKTNNPISTDFLRSFGATDDFIVALRQGVFTAERLGRAPIFDHNRLSRVDVAWNNLEKKWETMFAKLTAKHGLQFIKDITEASKAIINLIDHLMRLANNLGVFDDISKTITAMASGVEYINSFFSEDEKDHEKRREKAAHMKDRWNSSILGNILPGNKIVDFFSEEQRKARKEKRMEMNSRIFSGRDEFGQRINNFDTKVVNNFHGVKDARAANALQKDEIQRAVQQTLSKGVGQ